MTRPSDFWSRRRAAVQAEQAQETAALEAAALQPDPEMSDDEILASLELPDPDSLTQGGDFAAFMSRKVPEHLRRRALRKLWRSNPVLACLDGLNDYDEDFTDATCAMPGVKTAYQVGKGMLHHIQEMARQAEEAEAAKAAPDVEDPAVPMALTETSDPEPVDADEPTRYTTADDTPTYSPAPRRMQFQFEPTGGTA